MNDEWTEMSVYRFPSFQNDLERIKYESWFEDDEELLYRYNEELIEAEEDGCLDEAFINVV